MQIIFVVCWIFAIVGTAFAQLSDLRQFAKTARFLKPQECVEQFFHLYDFLVLLAAEWDHVDRLLEILRCPDTPISQRRLIITLFGETPVARGYPIFVEKLRDPDVAREAAEILRFFGLQARVH